MARRDGATAPAVAPDDGSIRARSRRSSARRSPRCGGRTSPARNASRMAVRDDRRSLRESDELADPLGRLWQAGTGEQLGDLDEPRAGDVPLTRIAVVAAAAGVLVRRAHVEEQERLVAEPRRQLLPGRQRVQVRHERRLPHRLELDRPLLQLGRPAGDAAEQDRDLRVPRQLRHLRCRHRADAVAAIDEHEPLLAGDPVTAQTKRDLLRQLLRRRLVGAGGRRAEDERARARDVSARVGVRAAHIADDEPVLAEMRDEPRRIDDSRQPVHSAATSADSAATAGRSSSRSSQSCSAGYGIEPDAEHVAEAKDPRDERDVGEPVLAAAEPRRRREQRVEPRELLVEPHARVVLAAAEPVIRRGHLVLPEDPQPRERTICGIGRQQRRLRVALLEVLHDHRRLRQDPSRPPRSPARGRSGSSRRSTRAGRPGRSRPPRTRSPSPRGRCGRARSTGSGERRRGRGRTQSTARSTRGRPPRRPSPRRSRARARPRREDPRASRRCARPCAPPARRRR